MLRIRRIEIDNFALFADIVIEPSISLEKPLTVIRGENQTGKTTLLRAIRWGMYGERGLPGDSAHFSVHPAWWQPDSTGIKTQVSIEFETDGSTRINTDGGFSTIVYRLVRSVKTVSKQTTRDDEPDFRRTDEQTLLMLKGNDGNWTRHTAGVETVIEELMPWGLRDFFLMNADEVADFVGGSENKVIPRQEAINKTTSAVHSLLGIDIFKEASNRVDNIARRFDIQATKAIGDSDLDALQEDLNRIRIEDSQLTDSISEQRAQIQELEDRLRQRKDDLETELKDIGAAEQLRTRLNENSRARERSMKQRKSSLSNLARELESTDLLSSLVISLVDKAYKTLHPFYMSGHIPLKHLNFVREILESGTCVCGQDLSIDGLHRQHLEDSIAESAKQERRADYLGQLHDTTRSLIQAAASDWEDRKRQHINVLVELDSEASDLDLEKRDIDNHLNSLDEDKIQFIRDEIATLDTQLTNLNSKLSTNEMMQQPIKTKIDSLEKTIHQRQRRERAASDKRTARFTAELVVKVLSQAYSTIQAKQVSELSQQMNRLFVKMTTNISDNDFAEIQHDKATLRMIGEVGLRSVDRNPDDYEIYALNSRQRSMPPIEINGASRRVLALSFVLALCKESRTHAPLIADSLLNFMSGTVRRNTLRVTAESSSQPILLLTGSDLAAPSEVDTVVQYAGSTYTLTGQWDAIDAAEDGGDVVNWTDQRQVSLVCSCGPRQYCDICERIGQADSPGWSKRL